MVRGLRGGHSHDCHILLIAVFFYLPTKHTSPLFTEDFFNQNQPFHHYNFLISTYTWWILSTVWLLISLTFLLPVISTMFISAIAKVSLPRVTPFSNISYKLLTFPLAIISAHSLTNWFLINQTWSALGSQSCHWANFSLHLTPLTSSIFNFSIFESTVHSPYTLLLVHTVFLVCSLNSIILLAFPKQTQPCFISDCHLFHPSS